MQPSDSPFYRVWNADQTLGDPIELPALVGQVRAGKVGAGTWLFSSQMNQWARADQLPELGLFFTKRKPDGSQPKDLSRPGDSGIKPGSLRRIKVLADLSEAQLGAFWKRLEVQRPKQFAQIVSKGDYGDAMYFVLEGELRARVIVEGSETTLATFGPGEFFGEISLLDQGPRSADVVANADSLILKLTVSAFEALLHEDPGAAAPFLFALSRSVVGRMRIATKRYQDSIHFLRIGAAVH